MAVTLESGYVDDHASALIKSYKRALLVSSIMLAAVLKYLIWNWSK